MVEQPCPVKLAEKSGYIYLTYINEEEGTVTLKCDEQELVITRYSIPKSIMCFHRENPALAATPAPIGLQHLQTQTSICKLDAGQQHLKIHYQPKQIDSGSIFADYQLEINWT